MENNKLKLEHLAPYLPYRLKVKTGVQYIATMGTNSGVDIIGIDRVVNQPAFKPLLLPLADLKNHNIKDVEQFTGNPIYWPYDIVSELFKNHFDVFGLIDKGLALNKLTYFQNGNN